jgi:hypothetical protein
MQSEGPKVVIGARVSLLSVANIVSKYSGDENHSADVVGHDKIGQVNMELEVCCPYCITAHGFRRMICTTGKAYVCPDCGHVVNRDREDRHCSCSRCGTRHHRGEKLRLPTLGS